MNKPERKTNYQTFYKDAIQNRKGYVTRDGTWAAVPIMGSKTKLQIIHNGEFVHVARNYDSAKAYILREIKKNGKRSRG